MDTIKVIVKNNVEYKVLFVKDKSITVRECIGLSGIDDIPALKFSMKNSGVYFGIRNSNRDIHSEQWQNDQRDGILLDVLDDPITNYIIDYSKALIIFSGIACR